MRQAMLVHGVGPADGAGGKPRPSSARTAYVGSSPWRRGAEYDRDPGGPAPPHHHRPKSSTAASTPSLHHGIKGIAASPSASARTASARAPSAPSAARGAGAGAARGEKDDDIIIVENGKFPGAGANVAIRSLRSKESCPERLNLDRRGLTSCCILQSEEQLRLLNYQHNSITRIQHLDNLQNLVFLDMYNNSLTEISGLEHVPNIRVLMLGRNNIRIVAGLESLRKLDVLDIHGNHISRIEGLAGLASLRILNLAGNLITSMEDLSMLGNLLELNLRRNALDGFAVPAAADAAAADAADGHRRKNPFPGRLQRVFLSHNKLARADDLHFLSQLPMLRELALDGNPLAAEGVRSAAAKEYRMGVIRICERLNRLDMTMVTEEERQAAVSATARGAGVIRDVEARPRVVTPPADRAAGRDDVDVGEEEDDELELLGAGCHRLSGSESGDAASDMASEDGEGEEGEEGEADAAGPHRDGDGPSGRPSDPERAAGGGSREPAGPPPRPATVGGERTLRIRSDDPLKSLMLEKVFGGNDGGALNLELVGIRGAAALRRKIQKIKAFPITSLVLTDTGLAEPVDLLPLSSLTELHSLRVRPQGNPVVGAHLFRAFACACLPKLSMLNEAPVTARERVQSQELLAPYVGMLEASMPPQAGAGALAGAHDDDEGDPAGRAARVCRQTDARMATIDAAAHRRSAASKAHRAGAAPGRSGGLPGRAAGAPTSAPGRERAVRDEGERDAAGEIVGDALRIAEASAAFDDAWPEALRCLVEEAMREAEELDCRGMSYAV